MAWIEVNVLVALLLSLNVLMWCLLIFIAFGIWVIWRVLMDLFPTPSIAPGSPSWDQFRMPYFEAVQETVDPLITIDPPSYHTNETSTTVSSYDNTGYVSDTSTDTTSDDDTLASPIDWSTSGDDGDYVLTFPQVSSFPGTNTSDQGTA